MNPQQSRRIIPLYESLVDMLLMGTVNTSGSSAINGANGNGGGAGGGGNVLDFSCAELLEYPDLHVEALNIIQLFKNV